MRRRKIEDTAFDTINPRVGQAMCTYKRYIPLIVSLIYNIYLERPRQQTVCQKFDRRSRCATGNGLVNFLMVQKIW